MNGESASEQASVVQPVDEPVQAAVGTRQRIIDFIQAEASRGQRGATDEELSNALKVGSSSLRPRRKELVDEGLVRDSGITRDTQTGHKAIVWESVAASSGVREELLKQALPRMKSIVTADLTPIQRGLAAVDVLIELGLLLESTPPKARDTLPQTERVLLAEPLGIQQRELRECWLLYRHLKSGTKWDGLQKLIQDRVITSANGALAEFDVDGRSRGGRQRPGRGGTTIVPPGDPSLLKRHKKPLTRDVSISVPLDTDDLLEEEMGRSGRSKTEIILEALDNYLQPPAQRSAIALSAPCTQKTAYRRQPTQILPTPAPTAGNSADPGWARKYCLNKRLDSSKQRKKLNDDVVRVDHGASADPAPSPSPTGDVGRGAGGGAGGPDPGSVGGGADPLV